MTEEFKSPVTIKSKIYEVGKVYQTATKDLVRLIDKGVNNGFYVMWLESGCTCTVEEILEGGEIDFGRIKIAPVKVEEGCVYKLRDQDGEYFYSSFNDGAWDDWFCEDSCEVVCKMVEEV